MSERRRRVDWDEEIRKTERIRRRGIFMSALSFAMACAFIFGMSRLKGSAEIEMPKRIISIVFLFAAAMVFRSVMKRLSDKRNNEKK